MASSSSSSAAVSQLVAVEKVGVGVDTPKKVNPGVAAACGSPSSTACGSPSGSPNSAAAKDLGNLVAAEGEEEVILGRCVFDCGPLRDMRQLTNTGTKHYPRWMCNACNNYRKAIEGMARKDLKEGRPELMDALNRIKGDPEEWKEKIRQGRIRPSWEPRWMPGVEKMPVKPRIVRQT